MIRMVGVRGTGHDRAGARGFGGDQNGRSNGGRLSGRRALPSTIGSHGLAARPPLAEMRIQEFDRAGWARCWQASPPWPLSMLERRMPVSVHGDDADAAALNQAAAPCLADRAMAHAAIGQGNFFGAPG